MHVQNKQFPFCPPLYVDKASRPKNVHSALFAFGAWGDKFASFSRHQVNIIKGKKTFHTVDHYALKTALKVLVFALTLFILPAIALLAKIEYKSFCSKHINLTNPKFGYETQSKSLPHFLLGSKIIPDSDPTSYLAPILLTAHTQNPTPILEEQNSERIQEDNSSPSLVEPSSTTPQNLEIQKRKNYHFETFDALLNVSTQYIQKEKIKNKERSPIKMPLTTELSETEIMDHWFKHYQGFCLGEIHCDKTPKEFLVDNMTYLKGKGVKVIFMEQLYDHQQTDLDAYYRGLPLSDDLLENLNRADNKDNFQPPYGFKGIVEAAKKEGIRIVAIDTQSANYDDENMKNVENMRKRWMTMNYFAYKTIKQTMRELGEDAKFIAMMGSGHITRKDSIPGVDTLLNCPNMMVCDSSYLKNQPPFKIKFDALLFIESYSYIIDLLCIR